MTAEAELSFTNARFTDEDPAGPFIPGALDRVVAATLTVAPARRVFGSVRTRHVGPRPLIEDASARSESTTIWNVELGVTLNELMRVSIEGYNLFNAAVADIDYFYASRLPGEPLDGVDDIHTHPSIPRTARVSLQFAFSWTVPPPWNGLSGAELHDRLHIPPQSRTGFCRPAGERYGTIRN